MILCKYERESERKVRDFKIMENNKGGRKHREDERITFWCPRGQQNARNGLGRSWLLLLLAPAAAAIFRPLAFSFETLLVSSLSALLI